MNCIFCENKLTLLINGQDNLPPYYTYECISCNYTWKKYNQNTYKKYDTLNIKLKNDVEITGYYDAQQILLFSVRKNGKLIGEYISDDYTCFDSFFNNLTLDEVQSIFERIIKTAILY